MKARLALIALALGLLLAACNQAPPGFDFSLTQHKLSLQAAVSDGAPSGAVALSVVPRSSFSGAVSVSVKVNRAGLTVSPASASIAAGKSQDFTITGQAAGDYVVSFTGGGKTIELHVTCLENPDTGIYGTVTDGLGGAALQDATVKALGASGNVAAQTTTDADGRYQFTKLPAGAYTILSPGQTLTAPVYQGGAGSVAYASSEVVGVAYDGKAAVHQNLIQLRASSSQLATTPPTVSVSGAPTSATGSEVINFKISLGAGKNGLALALAAIGHDPYAFALGAYNRGVAYLGSFGGNPSSSAKDVPVSLNLAQLAAGVSGKTDIEISVVDTNNDRTLFLQPLTVQNNFTGGDLSAPVTSVQATAFTVANTRVQIFSVNPQAAPPTTTMWTQVTWDPYTFPVEPGANTPFQDQGYYVYRSIAGGPQEKVATLPVYYDSDTGAVVNPTGWNDASGDLIPGVSVSYTVVAFYGSKTAPTSQAATTTPLPTFSATLQTPAEQAQEVSLTPTFSWKTNGVGKYEYFVPVLGDTVTGATSFCGLAPRNSDNNTAIGALLATSTEHTLRGFYVGAPCGVLGGKARADNTYSFTYAPSNPNGDSPPFMPPLQSYRAYQWQLYEAVAVDDPNNPTAISVATDGSGLLWPYDPFGLNTFEGDQVFTFTTGSK
jgi:hypothetical protein